MCFPLPLSLSFSRSRCFSFSCSKFKAQTSKLQAPSSKLDAAEIVSNTLPNGQNQNKNQSCGAPPLTRTLFVRMLNCGAVELRSRSCEKCGEMWVKCGLAWNRFNSSTAAAGKKKNSLSRWTMLLARRCPSTASVARRPVALCRLARGHCPSSATERRHSSHSKGSSDHKLPFLKVSVHSAS